MKLNEFYNLRKTFSIIGLTGRSNSGCSEIANIFSNQISIKKKLKNDIGESNDHEVLKQRICNRFINAQSDLSYNLISYRDVLLFLLLKEAFYRNDNSNKFDRLYELVDSLSFKEDGSKKDTTRVDFKVIKDKIELLFRTHNCVVDFLNKHSLSKKDEYLSVDFYDFYFNSFKIFSEQFIEILTKYDYFLRSLFFHDLATRIRANGKVDNNSVNENTKVYSIVEKINWIIKSHRNNSRGQSTRYIIDSLKNSLELTYFKEKYSAFFMLSVNTFEEERLEKLNFKLKENYGDNTSEILKQKNLLFKLDEVEYKSKEVNSGVFASPDIESCIQKSDYHIFYSNEYIGKLDHLVSDTKLSKVNESYFTLNKYNQLAKFISLIFNPGLVTPSITERTMQIAFTAKLSSGCISRQVGAVVTDVNFSVKSIGWNDVAEFQIPCNLRDFRDLRDDVNKSHFSEYELNNGDKENLNYQDGLSFKSKLIDRYSVHPELDDLLDGKTCSYCFKSCHNDFEAKDNQVHTRSLHAEENAMLQISKYGGQALNGGFLFTTASPCELCAKKAFQLGLSKIYYIDPYPGISRFHTLKNGVSDEYNPILIMYQGAIGRGFLRLYQPFMAVKDELAIMTNTKFGVKS